MLSNIKKLIKFVKIPGSKPADSKGGIKSFSFGVVHFISLISFGIFLTILSAFYIGANAVPFSWERIAGTVNTVSRDESGSKESKYIVTIVYKLNSQTYSVRDARSGDRPARNDTEVVYYNPKNPSESMVDTGGALLYVAWVPLLTGLGLILIGGIQQYIAINRKRTIIHLVNEGIALPSRVVNVDVVDKKSFIQKVFYVKYVFFKVSAIPVTSGGEGKTYLSEQLMWRSKMYGDVNGLVDKQVAVTIYVDGKDPNRYYLQPPIIDVVDTLDAIPAEPLLEEVDEPVLFSPIYTDIATSDEVLSTIQVDGPLGIVETDDNGGFDELNFEAVSDQYLNSASDVATSSTSPSVVINPDDGIAQDDIKELEESLAVFSASPSLIDLDFTSDSESVDNTQTSFNGGLDAVAIDSARFDSTPLSSPAHPLQSGSSATSENYTDIQTVMPEFNSLGVQGADSYENNEMSGYGAVISAGQPSYNEVQPTTSIYVEQAYAPIIEPTPTPIQALSREEVVNATLSSRRISVPRR